MSFFSALRDAIRHFAEHGYANVRHVEDWAHKLRLAADAEHDHQATYERVRRGMESQFERHMRSQGVAARKRPKIEPWTRERLMPEARDELENRIHAATDLIRLNRDEAVDRTVRRFKAWVSSVPAGGRVKPDTKAAHASVGKEARDARFIERRVAIDQTAKMLANVSDIVATGNGAIGGFWDATFDIVRDHRTNHVGWHDLWFTAKDNWALKAGYVRSPNGMIGDRFGPPSRPKADDNTVMPARAINCRCLLRYVYDLEDVPDDILTDKGHAALRAAKGDGEAA
jgi:hypothetical protein